MANYSDVNSFNPKKNPLVYGVDSIYQAINNLILTTKTERLFVPNYGLNLEELLFDLIDPNQSDIVLKQISDTLYEYEPRVSMDMGNSYINYDIDNNSYDLNIAFTISGSSETFVLSQNITRGV